VAKGQVDVADDAAGPETSADFAALLTWLTETLQEQVQEVRLTGRLTTSPACVVGDPHDLTPTLERMYRAMGQAVPPIKRILELNPAHPLVTGLRAAYERDGAQPALEEMAELIYGMALLAEGGDLTDPARFAGLLANRLTRTL
jgi:molecular chaperone HtpG